MIRRNGSRSPTIIRAAARPSVTEVSRLVLLALIIGASTWASIEYTRVGGNVSSVWIGNGILVGAILHRPFGAWPALLAAGVLGSIAARLLHGDPAGQVINSALANLFEVVLIAGVIRRRVPDVDDPTRLIELSRTALTATLAICAISGAWASAYIAAVYDRPFITVWLTWYTAHVLGMVIVATLVVVARREGRHLLGRKGRQLDFFLCMALLLGVCSFVFAQDRWPLLFLVLPPLLLVTFRHKFAGVVAGVVAIALTGGAAAAFNAGPFGLVPAPSLLERTLLLQIFVGASCLLTLPVAVELTRRSRLVKLLKRSEARYRTLADYGHEIVVRLSEDGTQSYISPAVSRILGWSMGEFNEPRWDLVHPDDAPALQETFARLYRHGGTETTSVRVRHRDGHYVWLELIATGLERTDPSAPAEIISSGRDISKRMAVKAALAESQARLRSVTDNIPALIAYVDAEERYTFVNAQYERLFGIRAETLLGRTVRETRGDDAYQLWAPHIAAALRGEPQIFERDPTPSTGNRYLQSHYVPDVGADGEVRGFYALTFDITPLKLAERELERLARVDALTGLGNRRHFEEHLREALARARRHRTPLVLMALDLDRFKAINDSLGHLAGDEVLQCFAERLRACVYDVDTVARLGGDEFMVLVEDAASAEVAELIARKLLAEMQAPIVIDGRPLQVAASIGIAWAAAPRTPQELVALADRALYAAKSAGRNQYVLMKAEG